ncbi:MAG: protein kinase [Planctomycetia bacterium]|nr:protein kinase [Planctomycetia bacterium]
MPHADAERDLLFGLLALQHGLVAPSASTAAFVAWARDKFGSMADYLVEHGGLGPDQRAAVEALVDRHLERYGSDPGRTLAELTLELSTIGSGPAAGGPDADETVPNVRPGAVAAGRPRRLAHGVGPPAAAGPRFRVLRPHAQGGLGAVFVAIDNELDREVALKQILDRHADDPVSRARFLMEARVTGGLEHPGIVPVYGLGAYEDGRPYYAMRFVQGESLKYAIAAFHGDEARGPDPGRRSLGRRKLLRRFVDVCNAIDYAHSRGVLHGDIKPGNIILGEYGETFVIDWGLARPWGRSEPGRRLGGRAPAGSSPRGADETLPGAALGTPAYMSPEQADGDAERVGPASDVYGLGATLYCVLTGEPPFAGEDVLATLRAVRGGAFPPPRRLDPSIDPVLEAVCMKAMALRSEDRYPTPRALADDVERWTADEPIPTLPESFGRRLSRWERHNRVLLRAGSLALLVVSLVSLSAFLLVSSSRQSEHHQFVEATRLKGVAEARRREAEALSRDLRRNSAQILLEDGLKLCQSGSVDQGSLRFTRALDLAAEAPDLERLIRSNIAGWGETLFPLRLHLTHANRVRAAFSRDGARIATASDDHTARIWDAQDGRPLTPTLGHDDEVNWVAFSPNGDRIVTASNDRTARVWDVASGRLLHALGHDSAVHRAVFSPDGSLVATASVDGTARVWDPATGAPRTPPLRHSDAVRDLDFSPDGTRLATASGDMTARVWKVAGGEPDGPALTHRAKVNSIAFSPDGTKILTSSDDGTAQLWRSVDHRPVALPLSHQAAVLSASFSPDGARIATASADCTARVWDANTGRPQGAVMRHRNWVYLALFSPDGSRLLTPSRDFTARVWDVRPRTTALRLADHGGVVQKAVFSPNGDRIATACADGKARIWKADTGELLAAFSTADGGPIRSIAFSPDGDRVVVAGLHPRARIWDLAARRESGPPLEHRGTVLFVAFSPDGARVVTAGMDGYARIWDATSRRELTAVRHLGPVLEANFDPRGERLITASADRTARVWRVETGEPVGTPLVHGTEVWSAAFSPDGRNAVTAGQENEVRVWDLATGRPVRRLVEHLGFVNAARFSPDGTRIVTGSDDTTARLWDVESGQPLGSPWQLDGAVRSAAFDPQGARVIVAGVDRTVKVYSPPRPFAGDPRRLTAWVEARTGLGGDGRAPIVLDETGLADARWRLAELGGPPN